VTARLLIAVALFVSLALVGLLGMELNRAIFERHHEQHIDGMTREVRARVETDLRIGLALPDDERLQALLEEAVAKLPEVASIEIDSQDGAVLFHSDRTLRGQLVPEAWRAAARNQPEQWRVALRGEHSVGSQLRDGKGQPLGYLVWSHEEDGADERPRWGLFGKVLCIAAAAGVMAVIAGGFTARRSGSRRQIDLARLRSAPSSGEDEVGQAARVLNAAREAIDDVDEAAHRIARFEQ